MRRVGAGETLLSSSEVAAALGVGVSSVKRWTDDSALRSVRTPGGHRRYRAADIHEFARARGYDTTVLPPVYSRSPDATPARQRELLLAALLDGDRAKVEEVLGEIDGDTCDRVIATALERIGDLWSEGEWSVADEHRASNLLEEVIDQRRIAPPPRPAGICVLAAPPGELHDLPLRMVRLVLERNGWRADYLGADVPWDSLESTLRKTDAKLLLMTARSALAFRDDDFDRIIRLARRRGIRTGIGGWWARGGQGDDEVMRFRSIRGFERWLRSGDARD